MKFMCKHSSLITFLIWQIIFLFMAFFSRSPVSNTTLLIVLMSMICGAVASVQEIVNNAQADIVELINKNKEETQNEI